VTGLKKLTLREPKYKAVEDGDGVKPRAKPKASAGLRVKKYRPSYRR